MSTGASSIARTYTLDERLSELDMTPAELAGRMEVSQNAVSAWLSGASRPQKFRHRELLTILQLDAESLDLQPADFAKDQEFRKRVSRTLREQWKTRREEERNGAGSKTASAL